MVNIALFMKAVFGPIVCRIRGHTPFHVNMVRGKNVHAVKLDHGYDHYILCKMCGCDLEEGNDGLYKVLTRLDARYGLLHRIRRHIRSGGK